MKLTQQILDVLNHAAKFNQHLVVEQGTIISSLNSDKNRLMIADVGVELQPFAIHNLSGFLRQLSLFDDPDLTFTDDSIIIQDAEAKSTYRKSNKDDLCYLSKALNPLNCKHEFNLPASAIDKIIRASAANGTEDILFTGRDGSVFIEALNRDNRTRIFSVDLHQEQHEDFEIFIKHSRKNKLNLLLMNYNVSISESGIIIFKSTTDTEHPINVTFYIASER